MMGYNEIANQDQLNFLDPKGSNSHKLRPLAPRLFNFSPPNYNTSLSLNYTNNHRGDQNHHFVGLSEESNYNKEMVGTNQVMVSSRWNPTPEQLRALEDLYRRGTRTPSAEQIQHITAQLRRYGKIEGKNVFYWFQNHKARERQKRRRRLQLHPSSPGSNTTSGGNKVGFEGEQKSCKWTPSSTINKESDRPISQIISEAAEAKADDQTSTITTTTDNPSWIQFHDPPQFQHNHNSNNNINNNIITGTNLMFARERNVTCQTQNNNVMVQQQPYSTSSPTCFEYHRSQSHPLISLRSLLSSKSKTTTVTTTTTSILSNNHMLPDNQIVNDCEFETPSSSPTLQLFPIHVRNNNQENIDNDDINIEMNKDEEIENDGSLLLIKSTCCNLVEKATNIANSISNNNNNPFPYYQFL